MNRKASDAARADERFVELKRAQEIIDSLKAYRESLLTCPLAIEPADRARIRELSTPPRDDHDRAVLLLLGDVERLIKFIAAPLPPNKQTADDAAEEQVRAQRANPNTEELVRALEKLCNEIADTETHGEGAHDENCSVCKAHEAARTTLSNHRKG